MSKIDDLSRVCWSCRRGMKELDLFLMPFFEQHYEQLSECQKENFVTLLTYSDPLLFSWFMGIIQPENQHMLELIQIIKLYNGQYGNMAL